MTYLELVQRTFRECGVPGTISSVTGQSGEALLLVEWVQQSLVEIEQVMMDWEWMRKSMSFDTVAHQQAYSPTSDIGLTDFSMWRKNSFRIYSDSEDDEETIDQCDYNSFRDYYLIGSNKTTYARPSAIAVSPNRSLVLGLPPDDVYTVSGEYYRTPQELSASTDTPDMPERYHMAIVYKAMTKYGNYNAATEQIQAGQVQYNSMLNKMMADQGPQIGVGGSLI